MIELHLLNKPTILGRARMTLVNSKAVERGSFPRRLLTYFGAAFIVSVAYIDPGNYGTDISGGASFGYSMLWFVWLAGVMAMLLQYLSGKIGIPTGRSLPELIRPPEEENLRPTVLAGIRSGCSDDRPCRIGSSKACFPRLFRKECQAREVVCTRRRLSVSRGQSSTPLSRACFFDQPPSLGRSSLRCRESTT